MPKFYVQSDQVQVVLDADDAMQAAVIAFQEWCERKTESMFDEKEDDCQLGNEIFVSEAGFDASDGETFPTLDILMAWQVVPVGVG